MSEREEVLKRYGSAWQTTATDAMADRIAELENEKRNKDVWSVVRNALRDAVDKHNAATKYEALSAELDELARNVESALLASLALTPAPRVVVTEAMVEAMSRHVYQYALTTHADIRAGLTAALTEAPADA
jgi:hypothetical protein